MSAGLASGARWRSLVGPAIATLVGIAILITLGIWQLERKAWKEGLVGQIEARAYGPPGAPVAEGDWPGWSAADDEFRRVRLTGTFLHEAEVPVHGLTQLRGSAVPGYFVFTPLRLADGAIVVVNRGFVPTELRDPATRREGQVSGPVSVTGLVRAPETRGWFVPAGDPGRNDWFVRDLGAMARVRGLERVAPFYVDADATPNPGAWPLGGRTRLALPNDHLQYAVTWFLLALTLAGVFGVFAWGRIRGDASPSGAQLQPRDAEHDQRDAGETQGIGRLAE